MASLRRLLSDRLRRFARDEQGSMAIYGLFTFATCCAIGAVALDVTHVYAARAQLQAASDAAAHAALYTRWQEDLSESQAKQRAIAILRHSLPPETFGGVIDASDITFGTYDAATAAFTPVVDSTDAVRVRVERAQSSGNPVATFLFRIVGVREMDVRAESVFTAIGDPCAELQGIFAMGEVEVRSNNKVAADFCFYSDDVVQVRHGNEVEEGAIFAMPDISRMNPSGGGDTKSDWDKHNPGLWDARRNASYDLDELLNPLRRTGTSVETAQDLYGDVQEILGGSDPSFITSSVIETITSSSLTPADLSPGRIYHVSCGASTGAESTGSLGRGAEPALKAGSESPTARGKRFAKNEKDTGKEDATPSAGNGSGNSGGNGNNGSGASDSGSASNGGGSNGSGSNGGGSNGGGGNGGGGGSGGGIKMSAGGGATTFRGVVLVTDCEVNLDGDVNLEDVIVYSTNESDSAFHMSGGGNSGPEIGQDGDCDGNGGAMLLTRGGVKAAAKLTFRGGTIRTLGPVHFAAQFGAKDNSGRGVSIISGGAIDGTSNGDFVPCPPPPGATPELVTFRLAR
ncbi:pilus assembly protein TadG-related protein [Rubellimicrobium roseum]|uniref:Uncharacterized protein n=1 Tax=Rubellimicrobium roseum TaxID=687525 RepID=A0A5C4NG78_9RHOB|nr:pilus assembly protein TadG-related protein [Rubellimicrobium roseum]TNC72970.1 hypothetical protein FHG71_06625 [Rubellimicrobium roseum]